MFGFVEYGKVLEARINSKKSGSPTVPVCLLPVFVVSKSRICTYVNESLVGPILANIIKEHLSFSELWVCGI